MDKYDHGRGSFAGNNENTLPGEPLKHKDNAPDMRAQFDRAATDSHAEHEPDHREAFKKSRQQLQHTMRPPQHIARAPDAKAFHDGQANDHAAALRDQPQKARQSQSADQHMRAHVTKHEFVKNRQRLSRAREQNVGRKR